jgi:hypothetical protein
MILVVIGIGEGHVRNSVRDEVDALAESLILTSQRDRRHFATRDFSLRQGAKSEFIQEISER